MRVLIADDDNITRTTLKKLVENQGHEVIECATGEDVLGLLFRGELPQLLILDWMMPGISGLKVCEAIRKSQVVPYTHIIFVTSRTSAQDIMEGWRQGANDYITKPVKSSEFEARFHIAQKMVELNELVERQRQQLVTASKMALLGQMASGVAHEINNPLAILKSQLDILSLGNNKDVESLELPSKSFEIINRAIHRITKVTRNMRDFAAEDEGSPFQTLTWSEVLDTTLSLCSERVQRRGILLEKNLKSQSSFEGQKMRLVQVSLALLENALQAIDGSPDPRVQIESRDDSNVCMLAITHNGRGIPEEARKNIFQPFYTSHGVGQNSGIGLSASQGIIQFHKGRLKLDQHSSSTRFIISLPRVRTKVGT